jgi:1-acyl-sn-glycerol-3-phosphate acyltransferase
MFGYVCYLYNLLSGWGKKPILPKGIERCVVIVAPHTSNFDLVHMLGAFTMYGLPLRFAIKKSWTKVPYGWIMRPLGAIGIDRKPQNAGEKRKSVVEAMVNLFDEHEELIVAIAPEGTRSLRENWKTGFYHVAKQANIPIMLGYLNYEKKEAGIGKVIMPTDNMEEDMRQIMEFYSDCSPRNPKKFSLDTRFLPKA